MDVWLVGKQRRSLELNVLVCQPDAIREASVQVLPPSVLADMSIFVPLVFEGTELPTHDAVPFG